MKQAMDLVEQKGEKIFVDVDALAEAFEQGAHRFLVMIRQDSALEKRVLHHSSHLLGVWTHVA